jgi:hypothetical protein
VVNDPASLLGTAFAANPGQGVWLGARRTVSSSIAEGWVWIDGTSAAALNCGGQGCGPWVTSPAQPEYVCRRRSSPHFRSCSGYLRRPSAQKQLAGMQCCVAPRSMFSLVVLQRELLRWIRPEAVGQPRSG